jgi:hypothetical protein
MPRKPCTFTQGEIARAIRGVRAAGLEVAHVEVKRDGSFAVIPGEPTINETIDDNPWDVTHAAHEKRPA